MKGKENVFHILARWFVRWFFGPKYEEKWFVKKENNEISEAASAASSEK